MKTTLPFVLVSALLLAAMPCQEPPPSTPPAAAPAPASGSTWSDGFGRATNYRSALANAIEDAVAKVKGISVARGPAVRSRLSVVSDHEAGAKDGWGNGESDTEREWVQQQIAGFVMRYDVVKKEKAPDGHWEVAVKALIASKDTFDSTIVIDLDDNDLRKWQLERFDEGGGTPGKQSGDFAGPKIAEYLRKSRLVKIVSKGDGVKVSAGSAPTEREKAGHKLVASHRVRVEWQPLVVQSLIEKPNKARPSSRPRPEYLSGGSVQVSIKVENLVENIEVLDETFTVPADGSAAPQTVDQIDAFVNALVDKAKALVAEKVFFALKPPVVLRKWQDAGSGEWRVEAMIARRVAAGYATFALGNNGSLASPDWQLLGHAVFVDGNDITSTFRLEGVEDPALIEPDATEVRPLKR
ncbi:MAG TPA: hypothetical protein VFD82_06375 [Planctomycetota bacterium]|nr:hypothetical protein [Planctomycetota bacterium]